MRSHLVPLLVALAACGAPPAPPARLAPPPPVCPTVEAPPPPPVPALATVDDVAREHVARMNAKDAKAVFAMYSRGMQEAFPLGVTTQFVNGIIDAKGPIKEMTRSEGDATGGVYVLHAEKGDWRLSIHVDDAGHVSGLRITEAEPPEPPVAESTPLALPVRGKWLVGWGGTTPEDNGPHLAVHDQRRAADLAIAGADGRRFKTDGKKNEDYLAYGQEVLAMGDGTVVTVVDGIPENAPGTLNPQLVWGNVVVIEHAPALFSVYAHLQPGKTRAKAGAKIKRGAPIGLVGNSGNSSEPHLHVQVQDAARLDGSAWGVEGIFTDVSRTHDGKTEKVARYTFRKGDVIEAAAAK